MPDRHAVYTLCLWYSQTQLPAEEKSRAGVAAQFSSVRAMHRTVWDLISPAQPASCNLIHTVQALHDTWHATLLPDDPPDADPFRIQHAQTARRQLHCPESGQCRNILVSEQVNSLIGNGSQDGYKSQFSSKLLDSAGLERCVITSICPKP